MSERIFQLGLGNAWLFMTVFIVQLIVIGIARKRVQRRSHVPPSARVNGLERSTGAIGNLLWLSAIGVAIFLPLQLGTIWFTIGLVVFLIGMIIMAAATVNFISAAADQMIATGAYRISRHPMYVATFLICLGAGIASTSWILILLSLLLAACLYVEAEVEERYCLESFGEAYRAYMIRSPKWIGFPKKHLH